MSGWAGADTTAFASAAGLVALLVAAAVRFDGRSVHGRRRAGVVTILAGAALGGLFFLWIAGVRVLTPTETAWTMQLDWHWHFLGWHFFRHEPWHLPPGRIDGYLAPMGTAIGFTDSIPLAALLLRPLAGLLPAAFQYLGLWMALCFTLQGLFGVLLMRLWTSSPVQQLLGAACFILVPTLLSRVGHPALCSHWLLLWALWLYLRPAPTGRAPVAQLAVLGLLAGLIHPYLAVMMLGLVAALALRLFLAARLSGVAAVAAAVAGVVAGWWLSGLFTVTGSANLAASGLTDFSMNLLGPVSPTGWSAFLPDLPVTSDGQVWEGFQYLGLGLILLIALAAGLRAARAARPRESAGPAGPERQTGVGPARQVMWPLVAAAVVFAAYSLSPLVTAGSRTIVDLDAPWLDRLAFFRATGRFFWPAAYTAIALALAVVSTRLTSRAATAALCGVVALQVADIRPGLVFRHAVARDPSFHAWQPALRSPAWHGALPHYAHIVVYPPNYCGVDAVDIASVGYLAGLYGLTLNSGLVARIDDARRHAACRAIADTLNSGEVDDSRIYLGRPGEIAEILRRAGPRHPVVCGVIDAVGVCVTARSYAAWQGVARLEPLAPAAGAGPGSR